jgi:hypothetical protein
MKHEYVLRHPVDLREAHFILARSQKGRNVKKIVRCLFFFAKFSNKKISKRGAVCGKDVKYTYHVGREDDGGFVVDEYPQISRQLLPWDWLCVFEPLLASQADLARVRYQVLNRVTSQGYASRLRDIQAGSEQKKTG